MKRLTGVLIMTLIGWNMILSYELYNVRQKLPSSPSSSDTGTIYSGRSDISSDVSELVVKSENKVVTVTSSYGDTGIGTGSGAIYKMKDNDIFVITNHHVIDGGNKIGVVFADGTSEDAEIVGSDALTDLALLKVKSSASVEAFTLGDSSLTKKGEYVIAMGSPLGIEYQGSVAGGLISGTDRIVATSSSMSGSADWDMRVFQIDAAINPGNSGGPLINMAGELIGINSMKISETDVEGFGFAIPINEVLPIVQQLEENGKVVRPNLGVNVIDISQLSMYQKMRENIELEKGIMITKVTLGGPAQKAGVKSGDIVIKMNETDITTMKQFRQTLYELAIGDKLTLTLVRDGEEIQIEVTLA